MSFALTRLGCPCLVAVACADFSESSLYMVSNWGGTIRVCLMSGTDNSTFSLDASTNTITITTSIQNPHISVIGATP